MAEELSTEEEFKKYAYVPFVLNLPPWNETNTPPSIICPWLEEFRASLKVYPFSPKVCAHHPKESF